MAPRSLPFRHDPIVPDEPSPVAITFDGTALTGVLGQSIAGVILGTGALALRRTSVRERPRGVFCGIGVCYDCLVEVNGHRDVRGCQRRAADGDVVVTQHDPLPANAQVATNGQLAGNGPAAWTDSATDRRAGTDQSIPGGTP